MSLTALGAIAAFVAIGAVGCRHDAEPTSLPPEGNARDSAAAIDRVRAARDRVAHHDNQINAGWPMHEAFVRSVAAAHRELWEAEMALARSDEARLQATDAYLRRAGQLLKLAERRYPASGSRAHLEAAREALAEAEAVARAQRE